MYLSKGIKKEKDQLSEVQTRRIGRKLLSKKEISTKIHAGHHEITLSFYLFIYFSKESKKDKWMDWESNSSQ